MTCHPQPAAIRQRAFQNTSDFEFHDFLNLCDGPRRPSQMDYAALWVNVAQLIVAIIALAVALRRK
ncbi:MAG TPA: hypothetical protein VK638_05325 [Edaphobacter sp.]|nr:hypothetical protein [Edaphobacter sp.]